VAGVTVSRVAGSHCVTTAPCVSIGDNQHERLGFRFDVTFSHTIGDVNQLTYSSSLLPSDPSTGITITTEKQGTSSHIKTFKEATAHPLADHSCSLFDQGAYVESVTYACQNIGNSFKPEVQMLEIDHDADTGGFATLGFNGHKTADLEWDSLGVGSDLKTDTTGDYVKAKLEALATVGGITVSRTTASASKFQWFVTFSSQGFMTVDAKNMGPLPTMILSNSLTKSSVVLDPATGANLVQASVVAKGASGSATSEGESPFATYIEPAAISAPHTTTVHGGTVLQRGIHEPMMAKNTLTWEQESYFTVEARDRFTNRIRQSGVQEVQIVNTHAGAGGSLDNGTFTLSFRGATTHAIGHDAGVWDVETALESLETVGDVSVASANNHSNGGRTYAVTFRTD